MDSETLLIENRYSWPDVVAAGFSSEGQVYIVSWQHLDQFQEEFVKENPNTKFVFFNNAFDINVMGRDLWLNEMKKENRIIELGISFKLFLLGTQGWVPRKLTLYDTAKMLLGVHLNKEDGTRTSFTRDKPLTLQQIIYLAEDCIATELCGLAVNNMPTETLQARASFVLSEISHNGMLVDMDHFNQMRAKLTEELSNGAKELRTFGFKVKSEIDKMTQLQRIDRICERFGVPDVRKYVEGSGKKQFPRAALWILTANLLSVFLQADKEKTPALPTDLKTVIDTVVRPAIDPAVDWSSSNKAIKPLMDQAMQVVKGFLDSFECGDSIQPKNTKADVALTLLETLEMMYSGNVTELIEAVKKEFAMCYDENLGWLPGVEVPTNAEFIQKHLRRLKADNPELELPLTDSSVDKIKEYLDSCRSSGTEPDPKHLDELAVYACKRQEMWRMTDLGIKDAFLDAYTSFKHSEKMLGTYFNPKHICEDGRTHSRFTDFLSTGRTASSSPNIS